MSNALFSHIPSFLLIELKESRPLSLRLKLYNPLMRYWKNLCATFVCLLNAIKY